MRKIGEETIGQGQWIKLVRSTFEDDQGRSFSWEHLDRQNHKHAVLLLATLQPSNEVVLIKQFRAGINDFVLALPAGMVEGDIGESHHDAVRELREETGYVGEVVSVSPVLCSFPALSDATVQLVEMRIDETLAENQKPQPELEVGEIIETLRVPRAQIKDFLQREAQQGTKIVSGLWYLLGL